MFSGIVRFTADLTIEMEEEQTEIEGVMELVDISRTFSDDVDENSATLPRRNGNAARMKNSSAELSSLFAKENNDRDDEAFTPPKATFDINSSSDLNENSRLLDEGKKSNTEKSRTPPAMGRKKRGLSPAQAKRNMLSPGIAVSGSDFSMMGTITEEGSDDEEEDIVSVYFVFSVLCARQVFISNLTHRLMYECLIHNQVMEVMDYIEDEIDGHTYDELIPLQLRMALEDQIFGWDQ